MRLKVRHPLPRVPYLALIYFTDINNSDIANITSRLTSKPYITQEVIWGEGQPVTPNEYAYIGPPLISYHNLLDTDKSLQVM